MNEKVNVTSMVSGTVGINLPHLRVNKVWPRKGATLPLEKDFLREAYYDPGVEYMFKTGILYIDDMNFKIELGLEEEGATAPEKVVPMDEKYFERVLKRMPLNEMKMAVKAMNKNQRDELVGYAVTQKDIQLDRVTVIKEVTGVDVFKMIELKRQREE